MKLKKARKSQDVVPDESEPKIRISKVAGPGSRPDDSYVSDGGDVLDNSRGDETVARGK